MWDWVYYGNPISDVILSAVNEDQRARVREVLDGMLRERAGADGRALLTNASTSASGRNEAPDQSAADER
jgi:hypothetical protein